MLPNLVVLASALAVAIALTLPQVRRSRLWAATVTPLASIIGSGFLVSGPLLASIAGKYAVFLMAALCLSAYAIGSAIRFNILHAEPRLKDMRREPFLGFVENLSRLCLSASYLISICFYVQLLSAFVLHDTGNGNTHSANLLSSAILAFLGVVGLTKGFRQLERLEELAVTVKLALIAGLFAGLAHFNIMSALDATWRLPVDDVQLDSHVVRVALGSLLIVQGFESSRYLGHVYNPAERVRSMRNAQLISTGIYLGFILLAITFLDPSLPARETAIIDYAARIAPILPILLIIGAASAQFSAAVADFVAGAGILVQSVPGLKEKWLYPLIALVAIWLSWTSNVFEVLTFASRGFAAYYLLQCVQSIVVVAGNRAGVRLMADLGLFLFGAAVSAAVLLFGIPIH